MFVCRHKTAVGWTVADRVSVGLYCIQCLLHCGPLAARWYLQGWEWQPAQHQVSHLLFLLNLWHLYLHCISRLTNFSVVLVRFLLVCFVFYLASCSFIYNPYIFIPNSIKLCSGWGTGNGCIKKIILPWFVYFKMFVYIRVKVTSCLFITHMCRKLQLSEVGHFETHNFGAIPVNLHKLFSAIFLPLVESGFESSFQFF